VKEQLSRHAAAELHVPLVNATVRITRDEFERAARPLLQRSVDLTLTILRQAGIPRETLAGLFLVGGSSRIPLVATLLHRTLGMAATVIDQPELAVATGSLHVDQAQPAATQVIGAATRRLAADAEPRERPQPGASTARTRWLGPARIAAVIALIALVPADMAVGGLAFLARGPSGMASLLAVQAGATLAWAWLRMRWIGQPGWGHLVAIVITTVTAVAAVVLLFRDLSFGHLVPSTAITLAIMIAVGALLPARPTN
jgi:hypothetical protein